MVKIPEDIAEGIQKIAKEKRLDPKDLLRKMEEIIKTSPVVQTLETPEEKIQVAWGLLASQHVRLDGREGIKYRFLVCSINGPRLQKNNYVTELVGFAMGEEGLTHYAKVTGWRETAQALGKVSVKREYEVEVNGEITVDGLKGTVLDGTVPSPLHPTKINPMKFAEKVYDSERRCTIADAELHVTDLKTNRMDYRIMKATVLGARLGEKNGRGYCIYNIFDQTFTTGDRLAGFAVACNVDQAICGAGSIAYFLGPITKTIQGNFTRLRMVNAIVLPITLIPFEAPQEEEQKGEVDVGEEG